MYTESSYTTTKILENNFLFSIIQLPVAIGEILANRNISKNKLESEHKTTQLILTNLSFWETFYNQVYHHLNS